MILDCLRDIYRSLKALLSSIRQLLRSIDMSGIETLDRLSYTGSSVTEKLSTLSYTDMNVPVTPAQAYCIDTTATLKPYSEHEIYIYVGAGSGLTDGTYMSLRELRELIHDRGMTDLEILAQQDYISMNELEKLLH